MTTIPSVRTMEDETFIRHLEYRHGEALAMEFKSLPGRDERRLAAPSSWRAYHDVLHVREELEHRHLMEDI